MIAFLLCLSLLDRVFGLVRQVGPPVLQARVIRRGLAQGVAQKAAQRQRVGHPPSDAPLRAQALEVADQEHAERVAGRRGAQRGGLERWLSVVPPPSNITF